MAWTTDRYKGRTASISTSWLTVSQAEELARLEALAPVSSMSAVTSHQDRRLADAGIPEGKEFDLESAE